MPRYYLIRFGEKKRLMTESEFWLVKEWYGAQPPTPEYRALQNAGFIEAKNKREALEKLGLGAVKHGPGPAQENPEEERDA